MHTGAWRRCDHPDAQREEGMQAEHDVDASGNDQSVVVTFVPPEEWHFSREVVRMRGPGKIKLEQAPGSDWRFASAYVATPNGERDFSVEVPGNSGRHLKIRDAFLTMGVEFTYQVTVALDGLLFTSPPQRVTLTPPPVIVNAE
jgi:hypothetical protein